MLIAIKKQGRVYIASDTYKYLETDSNKTPFNLNNLKIWRIKNTDIIVGQNGPNRDASVLRTINDLNIGELNFQNVFSVVIPKFIDELIAYRFYDSKLLLTNFDFNSSFFIAQKDKLFTTFWDGSLDEIEYIDVIGDYVTSIHNYINETKENDPIQMLLNAFKITEQNYKIQFPIVIVDTETFEFKFYDKEFNLIDTKGEEKWV